MGIFMPICFSSRARGNSDEWAGRREGGEDGEESSMSISLRRRAINWPALMRVGGLRSRQRGKRGKADIEFIPKHWMAANSNMA